MALLKPYAGGERGGRGGPACVGDCGMAKEKSVLFNNFFRITKSRRKASFIREKLVSLKR
jgi:hypothetical protein